MAEKCKFYGVDISEGACSSPKINSLICFNCVFRKAIPKTKREVKAAIEKAAEKETEE